MGVIMILECRSLKKTYRMGEVEIPALQGIDLTVESGTFTMIVRGVGFWEIHAAALHRRGGSARFGNVFVDGTDINTLSLMIPPCSDGGKSGWSISSSTFCRPYCPAEHPSPAVA